MNKNRILAAIALALSGCASIQTPLVFESSSVNSSVLVDTKQLGNTLTVRLDQLLSTPVDYVYTIDDGLGQYIASRVKSSLSIELLNATFDTYSSISTLSSHCRIVYNVNGRGTVTDYTYAYTYDSLTISLEDLGHFVVTPCLDRLINDVQSQADSL